MKIFVLIVGILVLSSCIQMNYIKDVVPITQQHRIIAVLPPTTSIERKIWMSEETYSKLSLQKQHALQKKMIRSLEFKMKQGKCFVDVMDFQYTNDIVLPTGYPQTQVDPVVLCKLLKVDAVIQSMIDIREPTNELAALFFEEQTGVMLYTNTVSIRSTLHDTIHKEPLWSLNASRVGYLGSLKNVMQSTVIRRTTRNTPYNLKKQPFKKLYLRSQE